jgi:hypothetical protein
MTHSPHYLEEVEYPLDFPGGIGIPSPIYSQCLHPLCSGTAGVRTRSDLIVVSECILKFALATTIRHSPLFDLEFARRVIPLIPQMGDVTLVVMELDIMGSVLNTDVSSPLPVSTSHNRIRVVTIRPRRTSITWSSDLKMFGVERLESPAPKNFGEVDFVVRAGWPSQAPKRAVRCGGGSSAFELAENIERVGILSHYISIDVSIRAMYGFGVVRLELGAVFSITKP